MVVFVRTCLQSSTMQTTHVSANSLYDLFTHSCSTEQLPQRPHFFTLSAKNVMVYLLCIIFALTNGSVDVSILVLLQAHNCMHVLQLHCTNCLILRLV